MNCSNAARQRRSKSGRFVKSTVQERKPGGGRCVSMADLICASSIETSSEDGESAPRRYWSDCAALVTYPLSISQRGLRQGQCMRGILGSKADLRFWAEWDADHEDDSGNKLNRHGEPPSQIVPARCLPVTKSVSNPKGNREPSDQPDVVHNHELPSPLCRRDLTAASSETALPLAV